MGDWDGARGQKCWRLLWCALGRIDTPPPRMISKVLAVDAVQLLAASDRSRWTAIDVAGGGMLLGTVFFSELEKTSFCTSSSRLLPPPPKKKNSRLALQCFKWSGLAAATPLPLRRYSLQRSSLITRGFNHSKSKGCSTTPTEEFVWEQVGGLFFLIRK